MLVGERARKITNAISQTPTKKKLVRASPSPEKNVCLQDPLHLLSPFTTPRLVQNPLEASPGCRSRMRPTVSISGTSIALHSPAKEDVKYSILLVQ